MTVPNLADTRTQAMHDGLEIYKLSIDETLLDRWKNLDQQPINRVEWKAREKLRPNTYNPNHVYLPELSLIATSILEDGWTQPIVALPLMDGEDSQEIVDGFHRWKISEHPVISAMTSGMIPVVTIDVSDVHRMMSTIRHNRARGVHGIAPMSAIVQAIHDSKMPPEVICQRLGMETEELDRLLDNAGMPEQISRNTPDFGKAWVPKPPE